MTSLLSAFKKLNKRIDSELLEKAIIGYIDGDQAVIDAAGRPDGYIYIQLLTGEDAGQTTTARNDGVAPAFGTHVRVYVDPQTEEYVVKDVDPRFRLANPRNVPASVAFHRHFIGSSLDDPVEIRRWVQARVWSDSALTINVDAFIYEYNGIEYQFAQITRQNISSHVPGAGLQRYIKVGYDPAANSLLIVDGATQSTGTPLTFANVQAIPFTGRRSCAIALKYGQTNILETDIVDLRNGVAGGTLTITDFNRIVASEQYDVIVGEDGNVVWSEQ